MTRKKKRAIVIGAAVAILNLAGLLVVRAMRENVVFFHTPSDIAEGRITEGMRTRIGGLVERNSVVRQPNGLDIAFRITDGRNAIDVSYQGILPDLFREEQGVVAEGSIENGAFRAATILAKHDENYMPREVADALKAGAR
jgi:cytochrome c-type biogenesis protein CcmE